MSAARTLLQQCVQARLQVKPAEDQSEAEFVQVSSPGSLLIVPQATLGGKAKGRSMQYHNNIGKEDGQRLYDAFIALCEKELMEF